MNDRFRNKTVFWAFVLSLLALAAVPSAVLMETAQNYYRFLTGFEPAVLKPSKTFSTPRHEAESTPRPPLHFVEFRIKSPRAKTVEVVGEFNGWKAGTLFLQRQTSGSWQLLLPLPAGRYRYHYLVDGEIVQDSQGPVRQVP